MFTAELDPLRDEGEAYAAKLQQAGCEVELIRVPGVPHTFARLDAILEAGKRFNEKSIAELKRNLVCA